MSASLLSCQNISKFFLLNRQPVPAVHRVSFSLQMGETIGLAGESGSGKSTIAKLIMGLLSLSEGEIFFQQQSICHLSSLQKKEWRKQCQIIFQQPGSTLNPLFTIEEILREPFLIHQIGNAQEQLVSIQNILEQINISPAYLSKKPRELSGGQQQRIAIARVLTLHPQLLILDEPFASLDGVTQLQIMQLLQDLQKTYAMSYLVISHDLSLLQYFTQQLGILYLGEIMEWGPTKQVYQEPLHPYTKTLVSSVLSPFSREKKPHSISIEKKIPMALEKIQGCPFVSRCLYAASICYQKKPIWREILPKHFARCHFL